MKNERIKYNIEHARPESSVIQPDFFKSMDAAMTAVIIAEAMPAIVKHFYKMGFADAQNNFLDRDITEAYENFLSDVLHLIKIEE